MPGGAKCWYFRFYWRNKRQRLGLGQWPAVGLAEARARAQTAREVLDEGIDPRSSQMFMYGIHRAIVADSLVKLLYRPGGAEAPTERALSAKPSSRRFC
jgi:hypothetical protein